MAYQFKMPPQDAASLPAYLARELSAIADALNGRMDRLSLVPQSVAPKKSRAGDLACADGTNWNPGAGAGVYSFNGTTWTKL